MSILGRKRRVIMVGGEGVVLFSPSGNGIVRETSFSWEVPNFEQRLAEVLAEQNQRKPLTILFDGADQTYRREENIPKLSPIDRPRFVRRKLELAFPSYPVRGALEIKPPKQRGAPSVPPSYLFVALPETENLDRVGRAVYDSGVPVNGFGLLPTESASLVNELSQKNFFSVGRKSRWAVLIGQHETGGLRQVVVKDGYLALTRLTPPSEAGTSGASWAENVTREFKATMTYVSRFGYNPADGLDVIVICGSVEKQFFDQQAMGVQNFRCLSVSEALKQIGISSTAFDKSNFADALHAAWVSKKGALTFPIAMPSVSKIMGPRVAVQYLSLALMVSAVALLGFSAHSYYRYQSQQGDLEQKQNQKAILEREYAQESKVFDDLPVRVEALKSTLAVKTLAEKNTVHLQKIITQLKAALGEEILLQELIFNHIADTPLNPDAAPASNTTPGARALKRRMTQNPNDPAAVDAPVAASDRGTIALSFKFMLPPEFSLEQKVKRAEALQLALRGQFPDLDVEIVSQFGRVSPGGKFTGAAAESDTAAAMDAAPTPEDVAEFKLEGPAP